MMEDVSIDFDGFIHALENLFFKDFVILDAKAFVDKTWNEFAELTMMIDWICFCFCREIILMRIAQMLKVKCDFSMFASPIYTMLAL